MYRTFFSFSCIMLFSALVVWYIFNIQVVEGKRWRALSDSMSLKYKLIRAVRGNIYADDGTLLATSVPRYEVRMDLTVLPQDTFNKYIPGISERLAKKFGDKPASVYLEEFIQAKNEKNRYFLIRKKLSFLDIKDFKQWPLFKKSRYKSGLIIEEETYRVMPYKNMLARTIGYAGNGIDKPRVGIEGAFNTELSGISGKRLVQKISGGYRPVNDNNELEPVDGKDIYTTIHVSIQDIVNHALLNGLTRHNAHHGCAVLMDVKTGEIKAIANLTAGGDGTYHETFNYAIGESYEPGSTFKLISALSLLHHNRITLSDSVLINNGSYDIKGKTMLDAETSPFRKQTFRYAFEHSSNVGISYAMMNAYKEEQEKYTDFIKQLHLNKPLGLEIAGEAEPVIKEPGKKRWTRITLPWMSIGYELRCTPLQLLTVYNAVANGGAMTKPYLVKAIGQKGVIEKSFKPQIINEQIASPEAIEEVKNLLRGVVTAGTGSALRSCRIPISGKTGTARISDGNGYAEGLYNSSFAGYFPSDNPVYSIIVVINRPQSGEYFGGVVAAPVVKEIAEKVLGIQTINGRELSDSLTDAGNLPLVICGNQKKTSAFLKKFTDYSVRSDGNSYWIKATRDSGKSYTVQSLSDHTSQMPDLEGMGLRDALYLLENKKLKVMATGKGRVYWQSVSAGSPIQQGKTILLRLKI